MLRRLPTEGFSSQGTERRVRPANPLSFARCSQLTAPVTAQSSMLLTPGLYVVPFVAPCVNCEYGLAGLSVALGGGPGVANFSLSVVAVAGQDAGGAVAALSAPLAAWGGSASAAVGAAAAYVSLAADAAVSVACVSGGPCQHALVLNLTALSAPLVWRMSTPCGLAVDSPVPYAAQPDSLQMGAAPPLSFIAHYPSLQGECWPSLLVTGVAGACRQLSTSASLSVTPSVTRSVSAARTTTTSPSASPVPSLVPPPPLLCLGASNASGVNVTLFSNMPSVGSIIPVFGAARLFAGQRTSLLFTAPCASPCTFTLYELTGIFSAHHNTSLSFAAQLCRYHRNVLNPAGPPPFRLGAPYVDCQSAGATQALALTDVPSSFTLRLGGGLSFTLWSPNPAVAEGDMKVRELGGALARKRLRSQPRTHRVAASHRHLLTPPPQLILTPSADALWALTDLPPATPTPFASNATAFQVLPPCNSNANSTDGIPSASSTRTRTPTPSPSPSTTPSPTTSSATQYT